VREPSIKALHLAGAALPFAAGCLSVRAVPGIAELAGLETAGLENDGLENDRLESIRHRFSRINYIAIQHLSERMLFLSFFMSPCSAEGREVGKESIL